MNKKKWIARIIGILSVLFFALFSLDSFEEGLSLTEQLLGFAIHLIPAFLLAMILLVAWRKAIWGGILYLLAAAVMLIWLIPMYIYSEMGFWTSLSNLLLLVSPIIVAGWLFIRSEKKS